MIDIPYASDKVGFRRVANARARARCVGREFRASSTGGVAIQGIDNRISDAAEWPDDG